ncbi:MAG: NUDIX hydrolase [Phycisphaera sp.]|nr:NUDIX hydrolase [Phycisphaera sp.]
MRSSLCTLLAEHQVVDAVEAGHRDRMVALAAGSGDVFSRHHFVPGHFTASAFVLSPDGGSLLLILHRTLGLWLQPGGHVESDDEDIFAAARREAVEETGVEELESVSLGGPLLDLDIHPIPANGKRNEPAHEHFDVRILLRAKTWDLFAGSDAEDARWVPLGEVEDAGTDDSVLRAVRRVGSKLVG